MTPVTLLLQGNANARLLRGRLQKRMTVERLRKLLALIGTPGQLRALFRYLYSDFVTRSPSPEGPENENKGSVRQWLVRDVCLRFRLASSPM